MNIVDTRLPKAFLAVFHIGFNDIILATVLTDVNSHIIPAAFPGRIGKHQGKIQIKAEPLFDASHHVALMVLTYMRVYPRIRACVNVRYDEAIIKKAKAAKMAGDMTEARRCVSLSLLKMTAITAHENLDDVFSALFNGSAHAKQAMENSRV